jgi:hypothetical protein
MTRSKAIEYLDVVLKAHPRLRPGDFGQAVKLGEEALAYIEKWTDMDAAYRYKYYLP